MGWISFSAGDPTHGPRGESAPRGPRIEVSTHTHELTHSQCVDLKVPRWGGRGRGGGGGGVDQGSSQPAPKQGRRQTPEGRRERRCLGGQVVRLGRQFNTHGRGGVMEGSGIHMAEVMSWKAVEYTWQRHCLDRGGSGSTRQRHCLTICSCRAAVKSRCRRPSSSSSSSSSSLSSPASHLAVGETVILLHRPSPSSRCFNMDAERVSAE